MKMSLLLMVSVDKGKEEFKIEKQATRMDEKTPWRCAQIAGL
jgi:hypothetical protein